MEMVNLYRGIGKTLHELGAYRAYILNSKTVSEERYALKLEIAVDGELDLENAEKVCAEKWENIRFTLLDLNCYEHEDIRDEAIEDGIQI